MDKQQILNEGLTSDEEDTRSSNTRISESELFCRLIQLKCDVLTYNKYVRLYLLIYHSFGRITIDYASEFVGILSLLMEIGKVEKSIL